MIQSTTPDTQGTKPLPSLLERRSILPERLLKLLNDPTSSWRLPLLLFVAALALRLCRLGAKSLWDDEAAALAMSAMPLSKLLPFMFSHDPHGPIYVLLPRLLGLGWTSGEFTLHLPHAKLFPNGKMIHCFIFGLPSTATLSLR